MTKDRPPRACACGDPWTDVVELHRCLAYVPGDVNLWPNLSSGEAINLFGGLRGELDIKRRDERIEPNRPAFNVPLAGPIVGEIVTNEPLLFI